MEEWLYRISCPWRLIGLCVAQPWRSILRFLYPFLNPQLTH